MVEFQKCICDFWASWQPGGAAVRAASIIAVSWAGIPLSQSALQLQRNGITPLWEISSKISSCPWLHKAPGSVISLEMLYKWVLFLLILKYMWFNVSLQERNIQALGTVWTISQVLNNWAYIFVWILKLPVLLIMCSLKPSDPSYCLQKIGILHLWDMRLWGKLNLIWGLWYFMLPYTNKGEKSLVGAWHLCMEIPNQKSFTANSVLAFGWLSFENNIVGCWGESTVIPLRFINLFAFIFFHNIFW